MYFENLRFDIFDIKGANKLNMNVFSPRRKIAYHSPTTMRFSLPVEL